jgi:hypothetical protein
MIPAGELGPGLRSGVKLTIERNVALPSLAWVADLCPDGMVRVQCGEAVEIDDHGLIAGAWAGSFADRDFAGAGTSIGTALRVTDQGLVALAGSTGVALIHCYRSRGRIVLSNSLALAFAAAGDELRPDYAFYPHILYTISLGPDRYRREIPAARGRLRTFYRSFFADREGRERLCPIPDMPAFGNFAEYRAMLVAEIAALFANAADSARRFRYSPIAGISAGYDSPAAAVVARDAGCREAFTFRQSLHGTGASDDSGEAIARQLGLNIEAFDTFAYRSRGDLPEVEFLASSFGGGNVYLAASEARLRGRIVVSGGGGDYLWGRTYASRRIPAWPPYFGGYSVNEFFLRMPALDFAVPAIGASRPRALGRISRSAEMQPWSIGGQYDRPIARRILEEAGVPRSAFAERKRMITPAYDSSSRRTPPLGAFLSERSLAEFELWFAVSKPVNRRRAFLHNMLVETIGRVLWSSKLIRAFDRLNLRWPPFPARLWSWHVPVRKNAFAFNWAVGQQIALYRRRLGAMPPARNEGQST